jgi:hypothetical protein
VLVGAVGSARAPPFLLTLALFGLAWLDGATTHGGAMINQLTAVWGIRFLLHGDGYGDWESGGNHVQLIKNQQAPRIILQLIVVQIDMASERG